MRLAGAAAITTLLSLSLASCQDDVSPIGESIFKGDVTINVDSTSFNFNSRTVDAIAVDARSVNNLIGNINVPEFGELSASYVTQLLAAPELAIPDSIGVDRVDSLKLMLTAPRQMTIGDTLAPQQLKVYTLTKQLPKDIKSNFNPAGYYNTAAPVASRNYTLSALALSDSTFQKAVSLQISTPLPKQWGIDLFNAYRKDPQAFAWPATFNQYFPGIFIEPSFGKGAMANILATQMVLYYHHFIERNVVENDEAVKKQVRMKDSICILATAPEVLSSTNFKYTPSPALLAKINSGAQIITAPLGYHVRFSFPVDKILNEYWTSPDNLKIINNLTLAIPATPVSNDYGIAAPPDLLMILTKDIQEFFTNGKVPDNKTSFRGEYKSDKGRYEFASLREYIVNLKNNPDEIKPEDVDFTLIPVQINSESSKNYDGSYTIYITGCTPYLQKPAMVELHTDNAQVVFTFTSQLIK